MLFDPTERNVDPFVCPTRIRTMQELTLALAIHGLLWSLSTTNRRSKGTQHVAYRDEQNQPAQTTAHVDDERGRSRNTPKASYTDVNMYPVLNQQELNTESIQKSSSRKSIILYSTGERRTSDCRIPRSRLPENSKISCAPLA